MFNINKLKILISVFVLLVCNRIFAVENSGANKEFLGENTAIEGHRENDNIEVTKPLPPIKKQDNINSKENLEYKDDEGEDAEEEHEITFKTYNEEDILYRKELTREINLRTKANSGFFTRNREITKFIIEGVKKGKIKAYKDWDKKKILSVSEFMQNLSIPIIEHTRETEDDSWGNGGNRTYNKNKVDHFFPNEISIMEFKEDLIFHRRTSEWSFIMKSIRLVIPAHKFETGLRRNVAVFDYDELMSYLDSNPEAFWHNDINDSNHKPFSLAFKERLFSSILTKIANAEDMTIADMYGVAGNRLESIKASRIEEDKLIYFMDKVWVP